MKRENATAENLRVFRNPKQPDTVFLPAANLPIKFQICIQSEDDIKISPPAKRKAAESQRSAAR
jgi:hypothetical protein